MGKALQWSSVQQPTYKALAHNKSAEVGDWWCAKAPEVEVEDWEPKGAVEYICARNRGEAESVSLSTLGRLATDSSRSLDIELDESLKRLRKILQ